MTLCTLCTFFFGLPFKTVQDGPAAPTKLTKTPMEYVSVSSAEFGDVAKLITNTYPNACIVSIQKVTSYPNGLVHQHNDLKATLPPDSEKTLFHGTTLAAVEGILRTGFDPSLNVRSAYGKGLYFSDSAAYSRHYMRVARVGPFELSHMFVNKVLTKAKPVAQNIYLIKESHQVLPVYLISFYTGTDA